MNMWIYSKIFLNKRILTNITKRSIFRKWAIFQIFWNIALVTPPLTNISCEVHLVISKYRFELLPWLSGMSGVVNIRLLMINPWYTQNIQIVQDISNIQIVQDISNIQIVQDISKIYRSYRISQIYRSYRRSQIYRSYRRSQIYR